MLVKYRQVNPYTQTPKIRQYRFSLASGSALGKAFFLYTCEVFTSKWVQEDFLYKLEFYNLYGLIKEPHRT